MTDIIQFVATISGPTPQMEQLYNLFNGCVYNHSGLNLFTTILLQNNAKTLNKSNDIYKQHTNTSTFYITQIVFGFGQWPETGCCGSERSRYLRSSHCLRKERPPRSPIWKQSANVLLKIG
jgi:hypothetical protein